MDRPRQFDEVSGVGVLCLARSTCCVSHNSLRQPECSADRENAGLGGTRAVGDAALVANLRQCLWRQRWFDDAPVVAYATPVALEFGVNGDNGVSLVCLSYQLQRVDVHGCYKFDNVEAWLRAP